VFGEGKAVSTIEALIGLYDENPERAAHRILLCPPSERRFPSSAGEFKYGLSEDGKEHVESAPSEYYSDPAMAKKK